jgi:hypothetical protein
MKRNWLRIRITLMRIWNLDSSFPLNADPDPTFHFYADPGPGPAPHSLMRISDYWPTDL